MNCSGLVAVEVGSRRAVHAQQQHHDRQREQQLAAHTAQQRPCSGGVHLAANAGTLLPFRKQDTVLNDDRANITASINVKSTITDAREGTERMLLDNPQINVIVTFNEWTTLGVGDAVEALGAGERTQVVAFDSNVKSIGMLEKGNVDALIVQNPYAMGYLGIEQINTLLNGQKPEKKETATSSILVTRENMYDDKSQKALFSFEEK